ncbi:MAG: ribosomal protein S18-alanine N-acetyltransferase [Erysipelotrichaceae bacterium]|nr:ribosomal protein S18-alanine N-acetyltransferase [Erysipelotrichaceae bacterium]
MITTLLETDTKKQLELEKKFKEIFINNDIKRDFQNNPYTNYLIYLIDDKIVGFINYLLIYDRMEIVNFNVLEFFQDKHIGSSLLEKIIEIAKSNNLKNITLEVRSDNVKAIYLYKKYGFKEVAIRKNYYNDTDGILMEKELM